MLPLLRLLTAKPLRSTFSTLRLIHPLPSSTSQSLLPTRQRYFTTEPIDEERSSAPFSLPDPFASLSSELKSSLDRSNRLLLEEFNQLSSQLSSVLEPGQREACFTRWLELKPIGEILLDMEHLKLADEEMENMLTGVVGDDDDSDLKELARLESTERNNHRRELEVKRRCWANFNKFVEEMLGTIPYFVDSDLTATYPPTFQLFDALVPPETFDDFDVTVEVNAGAGGQEAMLFAEELFTMYQRFAHRCDWTCNVVELNCTELGGIRNGILSLIGDGVFGTLKFEGGIHRVQRVPITSKLGKLHTSTASVAVLPVPEEINIELDPQELKWETFRSSGAGGQHVQKTDSAVRVTHLPSGFVAACQEDRSQHTNRTLALRLLHTKLAQHRISAQIATEQNSRRLQVGSRDRNEKIRTYNYPQDRVTDHRLHQSWRGIDRFMGGGEGGGGLSEAVVALAFSARIERLEEVIVRAMNAATIAATTDSGRRV